MKREIENWLQGVAEREAIPAAVTALNFGLFESENGYCIYLIGAEEYDETDDDWACQVDFEPKDKYLELSSQDKDMDWEEFQDQVVAILSLIITSNRSIQDWLGDRIITTGFDDGSLIKIK